MGGELDRRVAASSNDGRRVGDTGSDLRNAWSCLVLGVASRGENGFVVSDEEWG